ncbi:CHAT domain-containing protein [Micromonospora sp. NPDC047793]|uniref:CHAT domain-containing protein n=1 Tax=Micromonospora sp. NPDC047793 TaxID=3154342 RepID=UPI0033F30263
MSQRYPKPAGIRQHLQPHGPQAQLEERARPAAWVSESDVDQTAGEPTTFDPTYGRLADSLPERTALLCVTPYQEAGRQLFRLHWYFNGRPDESRPGDVQMQGKPDFTVAQILKSRNWEDAYFDVLNWWVDKRRLNDWIGGLLEVATQESEEPIRLVIWDNTDYQIPWELFYSDSNAIWLGAVVQVVRWTSIHDAGRVARFTAEASACNGGILALETEDIYGPDGPVLDAPLARYGCTPVRTMKQLLTALDDPSRRVGLVLVRCHGVYGENVNEFELGAMRMNRYGEFSMLALRRFPAVVFLNACDTASATSTGRHSFAATRSFAELFLRRGACSVVATLGQIDWDFSHDFAARLLGAEGQEQRLTDILLEQRRKAVMRTQGRHEDRDEYDFQAFFQGFAYVYFGHPDTTLKLVPQAGCPG